MLPVDAQDPGDLRIKILYIISISLLPEAAEIIEILADLGGGDLHPGTQLIGRDPFDPLLHQLAQIAVIPGQPGNYCL